MPNKTHAIAFVWENFGPIHADRCDAAARQFDGTRNIVGVEICGVSSTYAWVTEPGTNFKKITLFPNSTVEQISILSRSWRIVRACLAAKAGHIFFCHYEHIATLISATILKLLGCRVFVMNDSKFDDYNRDLWREVGKSLYYLPYAGGLASGVRSKDYLRFLGLRQDRIVGVYNSMSIERIRGLAGAPPAPHGTAFADRHFSIVARFVPKKNLTTAIKAYAMYVRQASHPRDLCIYGSGALEQELRAQVALEGLTRRVHFHGFLQTDGICKALASTLALLLPSIEEQFGNVVIEAQAMGVPVILSSNCGSCDTLINTGVNGFIVEPMNVEGYAYFMTQLSDNEALWRKMSAAADRFVGMGEAARFAEAVKYLVEKIP